MSRDTSTVRRITLIATLLLTLGLSACGGGDDDATEIPGGADPAEAQVIDEWAKALASGDIEAAAAFFAIPSVAENGPVLVEIEDEGDARLFNESLPCGAELIEAVAEGDSTVATFRLTERPGPGTCGEGTGGTAQTAFEIVDGKITQWRRVGIETPEAPGTAI